MGGNLARFGCNLTRSAYLELELSKMLPEIDRRRVDKLLALFDAHVPARARDKVRYGHSFRGNSVTLFERRPRYNDPSVWGQLAVAQFRRNARTRLWSLYCRDRNERWHLYEGVAPTQKLSSLVVEVQRDPTGIFFG